MTLNIKNLDRLCLRLVVVICTICGAWVVNQGIRQKRQIQRDNDLIAGKLHELNLARIRSQGLNTKLNRVAEELKFFWLYRKPK